MSAKTDKIKKEFTFFRKNFFNISFFKTLKYNFFCSHVKRKNSGFLVVYKKSVIVFEKGAELELEGGVSFIGFGNPRGSNNSTLLFLNKDSRMIMQSRAIICYGSDIVVKNGAKLCLKYNSFLNCKCIIRCHYDIEIGANTITGTEVDIRDINDHAISGVRKKKATIIGDHVWLGARVTVLGAEVAEGCVIGACSLVTKNIPQNVIAYGVPAQVHRENVSWDY